VEQAQVEQAQVEQAQVEQAQVEQAHPVYEDLAESTMLIKKYIIYYYTFTFNNLSFFFCKEFGYALI
jgi:hypothetical protein